MFGLENPVHLLFVLVVVMLLFGAKRLPEMGRSLGSGLAGFKDALTNPTPATELTPAAAAVATAERERSAASAG